MNNLYDNIISGLEYRRLKRTLPEFNALDGGLTYWKQPRLKVSFCSSCGGIHHTPGDIFSCENEPKNPDVRNHQLPDDIYLTLKLILRVKLRFLKRCQEARYYPDFDFQKFIETARSNYEK